MHLGKGRRPGLGHQPEEQGENQVEGKFIEQRPGDAVVGQHVDAGDAVLSPLRSKRFSQNAAASNLTQFQWTDSTVEINNEIRKAG